MKIQAHSAVRDLTPREGALRTNTAHSGPCCTIIANCRHFEACFPTHTSSTKSTSSQCLGMDSPASRSFMHSQCITSTAVALIFPCPEGNAAMAAATVFHGSLSPQPSVQALNPLCTEPWHHSGLPWPWGLLHRLLHTAIVAPQLHVGLVGMPGQATWNRG